MDLLLFATAQNRKIKAFSWFSLNQTAVAKTFDTFKNLELFKIL